MPDQLLPQSGAYRADSSPIFVSPGAMVLVNGSAALGSYPATTETWPVWLLDAAAAEAVAGSVMLPTTWVTVTVVAMWTNAGAGAGDVMLTSCVATKGDGETLGGATSANLAAITAPAISVVKWTTMQSGVAVTANEPFYCRFGRVAADVGDTLANDIGLMGLLIQKAS